MKARISLLVALFVVAMSNAYAQPQFLDSTFGNNGLVSGLFNQHSWVTDMALQADGKIVCCYNHGNDFKLFRVKANGSVDSSFGSNGFVTVNINTIGTEGAESIVIQPDGKIIAGGAAYIGGNSVFALIRLNTDGSLDNSFAHAGIAYTNSGPSQKDYGKKVLLRPDGRIVLVGITNTLANNDHQLLIQYKADGTPDSSFGTNGIVSQWYNSSQTGAYDATLDANGKILTTGSVYMTGAVDVTLTRYEANGTLDATFGTGGWVKYDLGSTSLENGRRVLVQSNGKIVVTENSGGVQTDFMASRFNTDGTLDMTFGTSGHAKHRWGSSAQQSLEAILTPNDEIIISGAANITGTDFEYGLLQLKKDGAVDSTFGINGMITTDFFGQYDFIYGMAIQPDGKLVAAGSTRTVSTNTLSYPSLARYKMKPVVLGVNKLQVAIDVTVYPNPNNGVVYVKATQAANLSLTNLQGSVIAIAELNAANNYRASFTDLAAGVYFLQSADGSVDKKIVTIK